jgi:hypothetical protein
MDSSLAACWDTTQTTWRQTGMEETSRLLDSWIACWLARGGSVIVIVIIMEELSPVTFE